MYGAQTFREVTKPTSKFENDVEMYGAQTPSKRQISQKKFENDVEMYGAQTNHGWGIFDSCLRMM